MASRLSLGEGSMAAGASRGLGWATSMLALQTVEWLVLIHVLVYDQARPDLAAGGGFLELYFWACSISLFLQTIGILLVVRGWHRTGGVLQLASCTLHLPKGEGIVGLVGGTKALRYRGNV
ncbi:MAG: hypothetical protein ABIF09_09700 [Gemmatimonadota bacterium]